MIAKLSRYTITVVSKVVLEGVSGYWEYFDLIKNVNDFVSKLNHNMGLMFDIQNGVQIYATQR